MTLKHCRSLLNVLLWGVIAGLLFAVAWTELRPTETIRPDLSDAPPEYVAPQEPSDGIWI